MCKIEIPNITKCVVVIFSIAFDIPIVLLRIVCYLCIVNTIVTVNKNIVNIFAFSFFKPNAFK